MLADSLTCESGRNDETVLCVQECLAEHIARLSLLWRTLRPCTYHERAEFLEVHVVDLSIKILGKQNPFTFHIMGNSAVTYGIQGRYQEAESLLHQVIAFDAAARSDASQVILQAKADLASIYGDQGMWKQAYSLRLLKHDRWSWETNTLTQ